MVMMGVGLCILHLIVGAQSPVRILPLGNSITYDENSLDNTNPRPAGDRIAYRYTLFQLLHEAGYHFDYVGSEDSGINYFQDPEFDDNGGFPGIETWQLTDLIKRGYNAKTGAYVTNGPYLNYFPAAIILLHIGTNNLIESASDVEALLDTIRSYNTEVIILVAKIINRQTYHPQTTAFNNNVESMVNSRGDDRIVMVNMESGANINYGTDMIDNLHPNPSGFDKMAHKWFEAIDNLNQPPEIENIPEQISSEGEPFPVLLLDEYVHDPEEGDQLMSWSSVQQVGSHLQVTIDENRMLHVVPSEGWHGSETVMLRVEDSGNGAFRKRDSIEVLFTINDPPVITSLPPASEIHIHEPFQYYLTATDVDDGDSLAFIPVAIPDWLSFIPGMDTAILSGMASENNIGLDSIVLEVSDGYHEVYQGFSLKVLFPVVILQDQLPSQRIYPNPVSGEIVIQSDCEGIYTIEIASLNGQIIFSTEVEGSSSHIDVSSLREGNYFVTIKSKEAVSTSKIIKLSD